MIALPEFPDLNWYLDVVKNNICDKCDKEKKIALDKYEKLIGSVISKDDFDKEKHAKHTLLECLILASYEELEIIKIKIEPIIYKAFYEEINEQGNIKLKKEWKEFSGLYDKLVRKKINVEIVKKYGIRSCPYCNENYIINREIEEGKKYATAQIDHFFPKDKFPIFAISLYNLIPSCTSCNHIKTNRYLGISPHDRRYDFSKISISYSPKNVDFLYNENGFDVDFICDDIELKKLIDVNLDELGIRDAYSMHKDYMVEIMKKAQIYTNEYRKDMINEFKDLFETDQELIQTLFGNYIREEELLKRPLAKLTRDLLIEFEII